MPDVDGRYLGEVSTPRRWDGRRLINLDAAKITLGALDPARFPEAVLTDGSREITGNQVFSGLPEFRNADGLRTDKIVEVTAGSGINADGVPLRDGKVDGIDVSEYVGVSWAGNPNSQSKQWTIKALFIIGTLSNGVLNCTLSTPFTNLVVFVCERKNAPSDEVFTWERVDATHITIRSNNPTSTATIGIMVFGT
ncbi:MAG: hypothetical protein ACE5NN_01035 [Candidatus Bathyarchaeia archaeon]